MSSQPVSSVPNQDIDSTLREDRVFPPPPEFSRKAHIQSLAQYETLYKQSIDDPEGFWAGAAEELHWFKPWDKVLEWNLPRPSGLSAASSTSATTASIATLSVPAATKPR